jgi:hypothetical protein
MNQPPIQEQLLGCCQAIKHGPCRVSIGFEHFFSEVQIQVTVSCRYQRFPSYANELGFVIPPSDLPWEICEFANLPEVLLSVV